MNPLNEPEYTDEILEEVWRIKDELARKFDYDIDRIIQDLREQEKLSGHRLVQPPRKRLPPGLDKVNDD